MSICFNGLGDIYRSRGQHDRATQFTREALAFANAPRSSSSASPPE